MKVKLTEEERKANQRAADKRYREKNKNNPEYKARKNKNQKQTKAQAATVLPLLVTVPSIGESGSVLLPKSSPLWSSTTMI